MDLAKICLYTKSTLIGGKSELDDNAVDIQDSEALPKTDVPQSHNVISGGRSKHLAIIGRRSKLLAISGKRHNSYSVGMAECLQLIFCTWVPQSHGLAHGSRGELMPVKGESQSGYHTLGVSRILYCIHMTFEGLQSSSCLYVPQPDYFISMGRSNLLAVNRKGHPVWGRWIFENLQNGLWIQVPQPNRTIIGARCKLLAIRWKPHVRYFSTLTFQKAELGSCRRVLKPHCPIIRARSKLSASSWKSNIMHTSGMATGTLYSLFKI